jgi:hypothetical protein
MNKIHMKTSKLIFDYYLSIKGFYFLKIIIKLFDCYKKHISTFIIID